MPGPTNASIDTFLIAKLAALREIVAIMGWDDGKEVLTDDEFATAVSAARVLASDAPAIEKAACGVILDMLVSGWREVAPPELVGPIVERNDPLVRRWRRSVLDRDGHRCMDCGSTTSLHAHHLVRWVDAPHLRVVLENGATLCRDCHVAVHAGLKPIKAQSSVGPRG